MSSWVIVLMLVLASMVAREVSNVIVDLVHRTKFRFCDLELMSGLYLMVWVESVIGCNLWGLVMIVGHYGQPTHNLFYGCWGVGGFLGMQYFTNIRKYNTLRTNLEILNIDSDEKLTEFIKQSKD